MNVAEYGSLTYACGSVAVVMLNTDATCILNVALAAFPTLSVRENNAEKLQTPVEHEAAVGVPDRTPAVLNCRPAGSPLETVHVYGETPPDAVKLAA
jgi:hypothetical protein